MANIVRFRTGKKLIIGIAALLIVALFAVNNSEAFSAAFETGNGANVSLEYDGGGNIVSALSGTDSVIRFAALYIAMAALLLLEIKLPKLFESVAAVGLFLLGPWLAFETVKVIIGIERYARSIYMWNLALYAVTQIAIFVITQSPRIAVCVNIVIWSVANFADEIVLLLRGTPLVPTDLYSLGTAMKVTNTSEWHFSLDMLSGLVCMVLLIALVWNFRLSYPKKWIRPIVAAAAAVVLGVCCSELYQLDYESFSTSTFDTESTNNVNGTALSFYINVRKMKFDEPQGYSSEALDSFLVQYEPELLAEDAELPNIIVIMNESFADLSYIGRLRTDTPYLGFYKKFTRDCFSGRNLVSVLGGGTCNTEFEYLTGLSMLNMPENCYAYMQHIRGKTESMASYLKSFGYQTVAMHPFYEICWKRNSVYTHMGFDDFISGEDMAAGQAGLYVSADRWEKGFGDKVEYIRTLISDSFFYDRIIEQYENRTSDNIFIFGVTVQNHSSYEYDGDDFETDVHIKRPEGEYPRAEQYLSLIKDSDEALEKLMDYFSKVEEKTVIVFFGDHQPNVEAELIDELNPDRNLFVNSYLTRFETPYFIWTNYEYEDTPKNLGVTSANYLGLKTLQVAGIPLSEKYQMLRDVEDVAPAMATWGYFDKYMTWCSREDTYKEEILNMYNYYTYRALKEGR